MKEKIKIEPIDNNWRLQEIKINFENGYSFKTNPEEQVDRYEGMIRFQNGQNESFSFKVKPDMAARYIELISEDIVIAATGLGERLKESLGLIK